MAIGLFEMAVGFGIESATKWLSVRQIGAVDSLFGASHCPHTAIIRRKKRTQEPIVAILRRIDGGESA
jgi:hypothetical protein